jgi:hypothetical protein
MEEYASKHAKVIWDFEVEAFTMVFVLTSSVDWSRDFMQII